jgi:hypothetical protein
LWIVALGVYLTAPIVFTFCATFPHPLIRSQWLWAVVWTPPLLWLIPRVSLAYQMLYNPNQVGAFPDWVHHGLDTVASAYFFAAPIAIAVSYRRLIDVNERRRMRILVIGSVVGFLALVPPILLAANPTLSQTLVGNLLLSAPVFILSVLLCFLVFPLSIAYSVLRHRLFDVRIIIRQGLQYAMARGVLLSVIPLLSDLSCPIGHVRIRWNAFL